MLRQVGVEFNYRDVYAFGREYSNLYRNAAEKARFRSDIENLIQHLEIQLDFPPTNQRRPRYQQEMDVRDFLFAPLLDTKMPDTSRAQSARSNKVLLFDDPPPRQQPDANPGTSARGSFNEPPPCQQPGFGTN